MRVINADRNVIFLFKVQIYLISVKIQLGLIYLDIIGIGEQSKDVSPNIKPSLFSTKISLCRIITTLFKQLLIKLPKFTANINY